MLVSKIKPCMSKYKQLYGETANGSVGHGARFEARGGSTLSRRCQNARTFCSRPEGTRSHGLALEFGVQRLDDDGGLPGAPSNIVSAAASPR